MGAFDEAPGPAENQQETQEVDSGEVKQHPTDVEGVFANDVVKHGNIEFPVFDCGEDEFYQNMVMGRKRLRFKSGSAASQYMSKTKYNRPFFIRTTDSKGQTFTRKVK